VGADSAVIQLVTRCTSTEEFIERFARFTTETDVVVPALPQVRVGSEGPFVIRLHDQTVVMKGRGEVTEIRPIPGATGPTRALMRLHLREMDAHSAGIHLRLMERRASLPKQPAMPGPAPATAPPLAPAAQLPKPVGSSFIPGASAAVVPADSPGAVASAVPVADARSPQDTDTVVSERSEERVPGAAFTLPANPFGDLEAADLASFIEAQLAPETGWQMRLHHARRITRRAAPYAACLFGGLLIGAALRSLGAPAVAPPPEAAPPAAPVPVPVEEVQAPAPRDCIARVTTRPKGATVLWADIELGASPLERVAIPCGSATVTLRREQYAEVTRTITSTRESPTVVVARLQRPPAKVVVTSSPPNAIIKVNKRRVGPAPSTIDARRFQRVRIEASLRGYRPWRKTLVLTDEESQIDVKLVRVRQRIAQKVSRFPVLVASGLEDVRAGQDPGASSVADRRRGRL
jgi:hypothetical protein